MNHLRIPRISAFLVAIVAVNLLLLVVYLWSRGGQTIHVRVEARGDEFTAYIDGQLRARAQFDAPEEGGMVVALQDTEQQKIPSLPNPRGIDSLRVTDLQSGNVLFEDGFSSGYAPQWTEVTGTLNNRDGVLDSDGPGELAINDRVWRDYAVDVEYKNITNGAVTIRTEDGTTGVAYRFTLFRDPFDELALLDQGETVARVGGEPIELKRTETIKALVAMVLRPYPLVLLLIGVGFGAVFALQFLRISRMPLRFSPVVAKLPWFAIGALAAGAFGITLFLNYVVGSHMPHVPDELSYIFQAKLFASGRLTAPPPPIPEAFHFTAPFSPLLRISDEAWTSVYPFGHPLLLAFGAKVGAVWLIPPLIGAGSVALIFLVGRHIYNTRVGLLAALLLTTSPFFLMTTTNFMSHNTAALYLLASVLFLALIDRRPVVYGILAGLFFGLLFNTRPFTAVVLMPAFGAFLLSPLLASDRRILGAKQIGAFVGGGLVMLLAYLLYNYGTTGDAFRTAYTASGDPAEAIGFRDGHTVNLGVQNEKTWVAHLLLVLNGWPQYIGLMFVLLPIVLAMRHRWDWFLLGCVVSTMAAWMLYWSHSIIYGPRYWYEAVPFLMLLTARGADRTSELLASGAGWLRYRLSGFAIDRRPLWAGVVVVYAFVFALVGGSLYGWLLGNQEPWRGLPLTPQTAADLEGFWGMDDRLVELIDSAELDNALILVEDCPRDWQCYASVAWMNSPLLDGDIVFARDVAERREEIIRAFPGRDVYLATFRSPSLTVYEGPPVNDGPATASGAIQ